MSQSSNPFDREALRRAYSAFLSEDRVLLSGHSHQAWPDTLRVAMAQYFDDSARWVDDKWGEVVFPKLEKVGQGILTRLGFDPEDAIAFAPNTHELGYRLMTCLPLHERPRIVTTTSEFHSLYRQLSRLAEEGVEVVWVDSQPRATLTERLIAAITPETAMVAFSGVLYEDSYVVQDIEAIVARAEAVGAIPLVDAYHAFNVVPLSWGKARDSLFVTAGGYKYAGFGEGICWLRVPPRCELRPVYTGWFADFEHLADRRGSRISYGAAGARFAGSTFDPSCVYRAEAGLAHWDHFGLDVPGLRLESVRQTSRICERLAHEGSLAIASSVDAARRGGFVSIHTPHASALVKRLGERGVQVDARGELLRLGPAPYLRDVDLDRGVDVLIEESRKLA